MHNSILICLSIIWKTHPVIRLIIIIYLSPYLCLISLWVFCVYFYALSSLINKSDLSFYCYKAKNLFLAFPNVSSYLSMKLCSSLYSYKIWEILITQFDNDWEFIHDQDIVTNSSYGGNDTQLQYPTIFYTKLILNHPRSFWK